jgi:CO/xanthine dehydrogenase FAD-binding subunit
MTYIFLNKYFRIFYKLSEVKGLKEFDYLRPRTLEEALEILENQGPAVIYNGGTDVLVRIQEGLLEVKTLMDIKAILELGGIKYDNSRGLRIGALSTLNEICQNEAVKGFYPLLAQAAHSIGSMQIRNRATLVGNICNASPLADTAPVLLVTGAMIIAAGKGYTREIPVEEFFKGVRKTCLRQGEIVIEVVIPPVKDRLKGVFLKHSRRKDVDLSSINAAMNITENGVKIALGAVAPTPIRAYNIEKLIDARGLSLEVIEEVRALVENEISPITDIRASREYRIEIAKVLISRAIENLIGQGL